MYNQTEINEELMRRREYRMALARRRRRKHTLQVLKVFGILAAVIAVIILLVSLFKGDKTPTQDGSHSSASSSQQQEEDPSGSEGSGEPEDPSDPGSGEDEPFDDSLPEWVTVKLLPVNNYSRPGTPLEVVNGVVVHYVGNPNTTAAQNWEYFESLATTHDTYASSQFIIGLDGEVLLCVPLDEVAYCSNNRNNDTISIECCHPDDTGEFTQATMDSLIKLLKWLSRVYDLDKEDIIRHYDVSGKVCPKYYVDNPTAWEALRDSVFA